MRVIGLMGGVVFSWGLPFGCGQGVLIALASCRLGACLACTPGDTGWECSLRSTRAGRCFSDLNCLDGLYCSNPGGTFDGRCEVRKVAGEECTRPTECVSLVRRNASCVAEDDVQAAYCLE